MCGVFGIHAPERDVARLSYFGLFALQHRGQESAGIAVSDDGRLTVLRDMGLVTQVFSEQKLSGLRGQTAIGHCRYSTTGSTHWSNAQPIVQHGPARTVALAHNGNLTNTEELRSELTERGVRLSSTSDTEVIAGLVAHDERPLEEAVAAAMARIEGAFAAVLLSEGKLIGFRDPDGIRPLALGRLEGDYVARLGRAARSTSSAPSPCGSCSRASSSSWTPMASGPDRRSSRASGGALCIFEFIYFARPDSTLARRRAPRRARPHGRAPRRARPRSRPTS